MPQEVPFLGAFAQRRSPTFGPLRPSLGSLVNTPLELYGFMQYMKDQEAISVLQLFLSLSELVHCHGNTSDIIPSSLLPLPQRS